MYATTSIFRPLTLGVGRHCSVLKVWLNAASQGIHQVLGYAGKAWVFERELATPEEIDCYWENKTPIWQVRQEETLH